MGGNSIAQRPDISQSPAFCARRSLMCVTILLACTLTACKGGPSGEVPLYKTIDETTVEVFNEANSEANNQPNNEAINQPNNQPINQPITQPESEAGNNKAPAEPSGASAPVLTLQTPQATDITDLILVTGQSNVRGSNTHFDPALDVPNNQALAFNFDGNWRVADLHQAWDGSWAPGNGSLADSSREPHNNFAFHFGKVVAEKDSNRVVGYVVVSAPGKGIAHWDRDGEFFQTVQNTALAALNAQGIKSSFDAILWHQGESDWQSQGTSDPEITGEQRNDPNYYANKLSALIADFRAQSWMDDNAYFICGETALSPVNTVLMSLNDDNDPRTACVSSNNLTTLDQKSRVHYDAPGLRELGKRYAEMYLELSR